MKYAFDSRIHFNQTDPSGHIYFANVFDLAHKVVEEFVEHIGIGWNEWFNNPRVAVPLRSAQAEYLAPLKAGRKVKSVLSIKKLGQTSVQFLCEVSDGDDLCAVVTTTHVFIDPAKQESVPMPEAIREKLQRYSA